MGESYVTGQGSRFGFLWLVLSWEQRQKWGTLTIADQVLALWGGFLPRLWFGCPAGLLYLHRILSLHVVWPWLVCNSAFHNQQCPGLALCLLLPFCAGTRCWGVPELVTICGRFPALGRRSASAQAAGVRAPRPPASPSPAGLCQATCPASSAAPCTRR